VSAFGDILEQMVKRVPGAVGAVFTDWDGEPVDQFAHIPAIDIQLVGAHWGIVFNGAGEWLHKLGAGGVEELWVSGEHAHVFVRRVTAQYYVVLATQPSAHLGTTLRELERSAAELLREM
jgi:predicted regulator of Ras-like GTPase activity (Roadblock/LC7/MglB family)